MMSDKVKAVVDRVAHLRPWRPFGRSKVKVNGLVIHYRWCQGSDGKRFRFNINPNSLSADYELWICGTSVYYLIPSEVIHQIYVDKEVYPDRSHEGICIVTVHTESSAVTYARHGKSLDLKPYRGVTLGLL